MNIWLNCAIFVFVREDTLDLEEEQAVDQEPADILKAVPPNIGLVTTGLQEAELERRRKFPKYRRKLERKMKYATADGPGIHYSRKLTLLPSKQEKCCQPTALLSVHIYRPFTTQMLRGPHLNAVYHVLSTQKLTSLRDRLHCSADQTILGEFSNNPDMPKTARAKDMYKSGFFFIDGTFYNDTRDPNCRDYGSHIIEWAKLPRRCVGPYHIRTMEETTFADLKIKLGLPYLYMHQGNCEHLMVFSDIRILHPEEIQDETMYPLLITQVADRMTKCRMCSMYYARWITQGSPVTPEDPCFFCDTCFRALHYDEQGGKIMEFRAYPYQQNDT